MLLMAGKGEVEDRHPRSLQLCVLLNWDMSAVEWLSNPLKLQKLITLIRPTSTITEELRTDFLNPGKFY